MYLEHNINTLVYRVFTFTTELYILSYSAYSISLYMIKPKMKETTFFGFLNYIYCEYLAGN